MPSIQETAQPGTSPDRVERAQAGDMKAFTKLVMHHQRQIYARALEQVL